MKIFFIWIKKHKFKAFLIALIMGLVVFGIPKIIDLMYFYYDGLPNTTFSSSNLLDYWGSLVGGAIVLIGVFISIRHSDKKTREAIKKSEDDRARQVKPMLTSEYIQVYSSDFIKEPKNRREYIVVNLNNKEQPVYSSPIAPTWLDFSRTKDSVCDTFLTLEQMREYLCVSYNLRNYGGDTALDIEMLVNGYPVIPNFSLGKHHNISFNFVFVFKEVEVGEEKEILMQYNFTDIDDNIKYMAKERFTVFKDEDGGISSRQHPTDFIRTEIIEG